MDKRDGQFHTYRGYQKIKQEKTRLTPSMEDYLEMIYRHCKGRGMYGFISSLICSMFRLHPSPEPSSDWLNWALWTTKNMGW